MIDQLGLLAFWKNYDRKMYVRAAVLADELGYDSFWLPEAWGYEIFSLLAEMAVATKRIKLGTAIVNVYSRSPGLIAMSAATIDEMSEGRFILGVGTSGKRVIEGFHGRPFDKPLTTVRDVIRTTRTLLAGGKLSDAGAEKGELRPFKLEMKPLRPDIPIYVAALKQRAIEQIGECADGWIPTFWPYDKLGEGKAWIAAGAARAGRDASKIVTAPFTSVLPMAFEAGTTMAKQIISFYIGGMGDYYIELLGRFGFADDCARIAALYKDKATRALAADAVTPRMIEALTITGDPATCLEEIRRRRSFGMDLPIMNLPTNMPWEIVEQFIRAMAPTK
jgi:alkanesulfonate monooxygenase SsuD/methylene tetrahydromethanopterin reductase-like flavin-dependent oxidoreductase (luciferase family)